ncbi:MAG: hypothetical protein MK108_01075 [Mariniblastus sp.]|nr:hypothetical protein [Mariniblastus sp.]
MKIQVQSLIVLLTLSLLGSGVLSADEPTAKEKRQVKTIASILDRAGRLYQSKKYEACKDKIEQAQVQLEQLSASADAELLELIKPEYVRLSNAHKLLTEQGLEMTELKPLPTPMSADGEAISFVESVAPILVNHCGRCHVRGNRGDFSAASYNALMQSTHVAVGLADESRLIEVIVDGDMPPNGNVPAEDLDTLKKWIAQGAKFDGDMPNQNIAALDGNEPEMDQPRLQVTQSTGKETVSFGLHVAPVLIENCGACHIDTNNPRGDFNMASFQQFLRGGDSGNPFVPGKSAESNLIKRLRGIDSEVMPPSGKLDDKVIAQIAKWIDEGGKFDGGDNPQLEMAIVAATARAGAQSHEELTAERNELARKNWKLIMSDVSGTETATDNFRVVGAVPNDRLDEFGKMAEKMAPKLRNAFKTKSEGPFIKGNTTIYLFERRYDFNELGVMLNGRDLPMGLKGYWDFNTIDAYASLLTSRNKEPEESQAILAQQLGAIYVNNLAPDVPRWFADGAGYWAAAKVFPRDDLVSKWDEQAKSVYATMEKPGDFATGQLPEHDAALVGYLFLTNLRSDAGRFAKLFKFLDSNYSFERAFTEALGQPPAEYFSGAGARQNRRNE